MKITARVLKETGTDSIKHHELPCTFYMKCETTVTSRGTMQSSERIFLRGYPAQERKTSLKQSSFVQHSSVMRRVRCCFRRAMSPGCPWQNVGVTM